MNAIKPAFSFLQTNWKSRELQWMSFAVFISVFAITLVVYLTENFNALLNDKSGALLGSDRIITSPLPIASAIREKANSLNLKTTTTVGFLTMFVHQDALALADVKAVEKNYPLRGVLKTAPALFLPDTVSDETPAPGTVWLEARLFPLLNLNINDKIGIGATTLTVTKVLTSEPDRTLEGINLAPSGLMNIADVPATDIIQPGSRVNYKLLLAGNDEALKKFEAWVLPALTPLQTVIDTRQSRPMINTTLHRVTDYLGLIFFITFSMVGVAIAICARRFSQKQFDTVALLRCLGASNTWILQYYVLGLLLLGVGAGILAIGCAYSVVQYLAYLFFRTLSLDVPFGSTVLMGFFTVLILLFGFALPSLLRLSKISPLRVLRRDLPVPSIRNGLGVGLALTAVAAFITLQAQNAVFTVEMILSTVGISIILFVVIYVVLKGVVWLCQFLSVAFQFRLRNLTEQGRVGENAFQVLAFALVVSLLCTVFLVRSDLLKTWQAQVPLNAPNYFVLNIPSDAVSSFEYLLEQHTVKTAALYPMLSGRLLAVNAEQVEMGVNSSSHKRVMNRLLNLTGNKDLQKDNRIVAGQWFKESDRGRAIVSVEQGFADRMNIKLDDALKFQVAEKTLSATVSSIRAVEWDSFQPNFFVIFPPGVIDTFPVTFMTSFYLANTDIAFLKTIVQKFPMVNVIDTQMLVYQLKSFLNFLANVIQYLWVFIVLTSFILLISTITATLDERKNEAKILRILGVNNGQLHTILLSEFLVLGLIAGVLGVISANGVVFWLSRFIFDLPFNLNLSVLVWGSLLGTVLIVLGGWFGMRSVFSTPPLRIE